MIFDKTGTLTLGRPQLTDAGGVDEKSLAIAAGLASHSRHPLSQALVTAAVERGLTVPNFDAVEEVPGAGLIANLNGKTVKLGNAGWCGVAVPGQGLYTGLSIEGSDPTSFRFEDELRPDAKATIDQLQSAGLTVQILSGDHKAAVDQVAGQLHIDAAIAGLTPAQKIERIQTLQSGGHRVLMVGDGLNDGPALAAGHVAMAPASAADVGRAAAGFVFLHDSLSAVTTARNISARALRLVHQNFGLAVAYNLVAVPLAVLGYATPLVAAIAMSSSSILVVANALRLRLPARSLPLTLPRRKPVDAFSLSPGMPLETRS